MWYNTILICNPMDFIFGGFLYLLWRTRQKERNQMGKKHRDFVGYGHSPPNPLWPGGASVALNLVINIEEGSEPSIPDGDFESSSSLCECGSDVPSGVRDLASESMFEFGSRVGIWRIFRVIERRNFPATAFVCALATERLPEIAKRIQSLNLDICAHGFRWEDHCDMNENYERSRIKKTANKLREIFGSEIQLGWYCRTGPSVNTRRLLVEHGGFLYDSDAYNDEIPYYVKIGETQHLVIPYSLCTNDSKFAPGRAFSTGNDFYQFMRDSLDALIAEGKETGRGRMMSVGLHPRLIGHAARIKGLEKFLDYVISKGNEVWCCRRIDIATHWLNTHPALQTKLKCGLVSKPCSKILVTGGAGFVLSNFVKFWLDTNHSSVCIIFDKKEVFDSEVKTFVADHLYSRRLIFFDGDITSETSWKLLESIHGRSFTHIVSGAAVTPTLDEERSIPLKILQTNFLGSQRCLEFARERCHSSLKTFIQISSDAVLSVPDAIIKSKSSSTNTSDTLSSMSLYALSKLSVESLVKRYNTLFGLNAIIVRFSDVYGKLDRDTGSRNRHNSLFYVCRKAINGQKVVVAAKSLDSLCWDSIDVLSVARGLTSIMSNGKNHQLLVYHLALGYSPTIREVLLAVYGSEQDALEAVCFSEEQESADIVGLSNSHWLHSHAMNIEPMEKEFGWSPSPLQEAVRIYMKHLQKK